MTKSSAAKTKTAQRARPAASAILFACNLNMVRSPMAAAIAKARFGDEVFVDSVGVYEGPAEIDPFAAEVMREIGVDLSRHHAKTFEDIDPGAFDVIVALTPEARDEAEKLVRGWAVEVEYWPVANPSDARGGRDQILSAFRAARDEIDGKIAARFAVAG